MQDLDEFVRALYDKVPVLPDVLVAGGEDSEPDHEIPTSWLGYLGQALAEVLPSLERETVNAAFQVVEDHLRSDDALRTGITTGLLEALANAVSSGRLPGPTLAAVLGPESRAYIDAWDEFTLGRSSLQP